LIKMNCFDKMTQENHLNLPFLWIFNDFTYILSLIPSHVSHNMKSIFIPLLLFHSSFWWFICLCAWT
jgi:hypothetical protein